MPESLPIAVAIVCKNNAATIGRTIESVRELAREIVVIDSGSTDGTIELLERAGARVIRGEWLGHVRTKQRVMELASQTPGAQWVLSIDSDESVEPELAASIRQAVGGVHAFAGYEMNRKTYYRGVPIEHAWQPEWRLRLVRCGAAAWGGLDPHDKLSLVGNGLRASGVGRVGRVHGTLRHDSFASFAEHLKTQVQHATTMAKSLHASGARGSYWRLLVSPAGAMFKQLVIKRGVLDGYPGWLAGASTACAALVKNAVLIELSRETNTSGR